MKFHRLGLTLLLICLALLASGQTPPAYTAENHKPMSPGFGQYLAIDGDTAIIGAPGIDMAFVFYRNQGGADAWGVVKTLFSSGSGCGDAASVSGDIAVVGECIFYRNQGGPNNWGLVKVLNVVGILGLNHPVSISGDTLVIGVSYMYHGRAYVFQRNQGGTDNWGQVKLLDTADYTTNFGDSVSISGDIVVIGAPATEVGGIPNQGAAYVFSRNQGGTNNWGQVKRIVAADGAAENYFGYVSNSGDKIVVGAHYADVSGKVHQGAAYVFYRNQGGTNNWGQVKKIVAADGKAGDEFGRPSIDQDTLVVSAFGGVSAGYVFYRNTGGTDNWGQVRELTPFGIPQISGNTLLTGNNSEAVRVFYRNQGGTDNWGLAKTILIPNSTPPSNPTTIGANHGVNDWSNDNTVYVFWSGAYGVDGYSVLWDNNPSSVPDTVKDIEAISSLTSSPLSDGSWYFHIRTVDQAGNGADGATHIGPFKIDTIAPQSAAAAPEIAFGPFEVKWHGTDAGSGISKYDIYVRDGVAGGWSGWQWSTNAVSATFTNIITGHIYYFRSQAYDVAGNVETDLPVDGDTHTTIAAYQVTGQVTNNRAQPVFNATVSVDPAALNTAKTSGAGSHTLFFGSSGAYTFTASRVGYGALPLRYDVDVSSNLNGVDFVLPPLNDVVNNGGWESGDSSGWSVGTGLTATVEMTAVHTGHYGVRLDASGSGGIDFEPSITQSVVISAGWARPTLSWVYQVTQANPGDVLFAVVSNESASITATVPLTIGTWSHDWLDLSAFSEQTVTLQFGFQTQAAGQQIALDEISVGDSLTGVYPIYLPLIRRSP